MPNVHSGERHRHDDHDEKYSDDAARDVGHALFTALKLDWKIIPVGSKFYFLYLVHEALTDGEQRDERRVDREDDIVELDGVETARESLEVFIFDVSDPIKRAVEDGVERVAQQVQREEVKIQADHRLPAEIDPDLRIERNRPRCEINPTDDDRNENERGWMRDDDANEQFGVVDDAGGRWISDDFRVSRILPVKADDLLPIFVRVRGDLKDVRRNADQLMKILIKSDG